jgi:nucleotide-binding universal stress UspA family protein
MEPFSRLLVGVDGSEPARAAVELAIRLAAPPQRARLRFVSAFERERLTVQFASDPAPAGDLEYLLATVREDCAAVVDEALAFARAEHVEADGEVVEGDAEAALLAAARAWGASCIALGTHGRGGLARLLLGSRTEAIVRRSPLPVLAVRSAAKPDAGLALRRIVCALDGTPASQPAFAAALAVARERGARLELLTVVVLDDTIAAAYERDGYDPDGTLGRLYAAARGALEAFARTAHEAGVETDVRVTGASDVARVLLGVGDYEADLLALGTHARRGLRALLGGTAQAVLRGSIVPVLAVNAEPAAR